MEKVFEPSFESPSSPPVIIEADYFIALKDKSFGSCKPVIL